MISEHAADMAQYYVDDFEIESCFLPFHEIGALPRNIHQPVVDFLMSGHPAQSASQYAWSCRDEPTGKDKLRLEVSNDTVHCGEVEMLGGLH